MAETMTFDLVSPERSMVSAQATMVIAPGVEGEFGAMPGHAPFVCALRPGTVTATIDGKEQKFVVFGGFAEVGPDRITVLADEVSALADTKAGSVDKRISEAEEALASAASDDIMRRTQRLADLKALKTALGG